MQAWYLLYCKGRKEKAVKQAFEQLGVTSFLPQLDVEKIVAGKKKLVATPLFPNYIFVRFDPHITPYSHITRVPNVAAIVRPNGQLAPVELSVVVTLREALKQRQAQQQRDQATAPEPAPEPRPNKGDKVKILGGAFANLDAVFDEPDGDKRSILLVKMLGKRQRLPMDNLGFRRL
ncbi:transcription/translation regulatory transformer protein RfaH [uncultured Ferrimonas sp.]|uniref:transcription/translation regulatory transformer protein RfaH n=1 Tax=uncultured Ferrimonas sp. TaxID=432640 RepID=UPI00262EA0FD|nr:transcription/translation regulatory transformer protein RfaH [uncultured Ferrimonas sp.]